MTIDPASLRIQIHPAEILRRVADPIDPTEEVRAVAQRMLKLMKGAQGIGLAGPQVGLGWRIFVCDVPAEDTAAHDPPVASDGPMVFINPTIESATGEVEGYAEGCLSLPGITGDVFRQPTVTVKALNAASEPFELTATGLLGRCIQHEIDHLDGVLILDRMTDESKQRTAAQVKNLEKMRR
ncbi:MAG: peptide deformylase [Planctomycetota bacterium]